MTTPRVSTIGQSKYTPSLAQDLANKILAALDRDSRPQWPTDKYLDDPVGFCRDILGYEPWRGQIEILLGVLNNRWTSVRSGHKIGKSFILAALALWWYCSHPDGKVLFNNSTGHQLESINWSELTRLYRSSGCCVKCRQATPKGEKPPRPCPHSQVIDGDLLKSSAGGLTSGERKIVGITSNNTEGAGGYSGEHLLVIIDEASALEDDMFQAFVGNTAAQGAKLIMVGNPTRQTGEFFESHHRKSNLYCCIHVSSEEAAKENVPGLASKQYCDMILEQDERGRESPFYQIRVIGDFPSHDDTAVYPISEIFKAQEPDRYAITPAEGRLVIAIDPAGDTGKGDESIITAVRGLKVLEMRSGRGWSHERHVAEMKDLRQQWWNEHEKPLVAIDADGVGAPIALRLEYAAEHQSEPIEIIRVYLGQQARDHLNYDLVGDEAHELLSRWLRYGGVFPASPKLEQEMQYINWTMVNRTRNNRKMDVRSGTLKKNLRQIIHRSPDRLDSMRVFAWAANICGCLPVPALNSAPVEEELAVDTGYSNEEEHDLGGQVFDPYSSHPGFRPRH